jgi:hypothetical protein
VTETGFEDRALHQRWASGYGAQLICPPKRTNRHPWSKRQRRWLASIRQMVETV